MARLRILSSAAALTVAMLAATPAAARNGANGEPCARTQSRGEIRTADARGDTGGKPAAKGAHGCDAPSAQPMLDFLFVRRLG